MQNVVPMAHTPLGRAAVLLCLASGRVEPNLRRETPRAWGLRKRWIGVETSGRAILAAALQSCVSRGGSIADLVLLAPATNLCEAQSLGLAARLCRRLTAGCVPLIERTSLRIQAGRLSLESTEPALIGDSALRDLRELAQQMGLEVA
jgi:exopolyphosphatase/guanosine-5'-triphosphate,3'-diphosphate pyrophosphatase